MKNKLCFLVCENYKDEMYTALENFDDVELNTYPSKCINNTNCYQIISNKFDACKENYNYLKALAGRCLHSKPLGISPENCEIIKYDRCLYMFSHKSMIDQFNMENCYILTSGHLNLWMGKIEKDGIDIEALQYFSDNPFKELLLLDTFVYKDSLYQIAKLSQMLKLNYRVVSIGLDYLKLFMSNIIYEWRMSKERYAKKEIKEPSIINKEKSENEIIDNIIALFNAIFSPSSIAYLPVYANIPGDIRIQSKLQHYDRDNIHNKRDRLLNLKEPFLWIEGEDSFMLQFINDNEVVGCIEVDSVSAPEKREEYTKFALNMSKMYGIAIDSVRKWRLLQQLCKSLAESDAQNKKLYKFAGNYLYEMRVDADNMLHIEWFSEGFSMLTGYSIEELRDKNVLKRIISYEDRISLMKVLDNILSGRPDKADISIKGKAGQSLWFNVFAHPKWDNKHERVESIFGIAQNITDRKEIERQIEISPITDEITGLLNKRGFIYLLEQQLKLSQRTKKPIFFLSIYLDQFEFINNKLGYNTAEWILKEGANIFKKTFRESDIIARNGDDRFIILMTELYDKNLEGSMKNDIKLRLNEFNSFSEQPYKLYFGIVSFLYNPEIHKDMDTTEKLMRHVDALLLKDKRNKIRLTSFSKSAEIKKGLGRKMGAKS